MKITVEEALIKTATVEIRTLTVSGHQVTLATYRQLDFRKVVDTSLLRLNGVVWGRVNYHHDCDALSKRPEHVHLIWQDATELCRDVVSQALFDRQISGYQAALDRTARHWVMQNLLVGSWWGKKDEIWETVDEVQVGDTQVRVFFSDAMRSLNRENKAQAQGKPKEPYSQQEDRVKLRQKWPDVPLPEILETAKKAQAEMERYIADANAFFGKLCQVQQLFIAT